MKSPLVLACCLLSVSALASTSRSDVASDAATAAEGTSETSALADAVLNVDESTLRNAIEDQAALADADADALAQEGQDSSGHEVAEKLRARAHEQHLKEDLAKFFRAAGRDLKKTGKGLKKVGVETLEITGYTTDAAADVLIFPYELTKHFVNSAVTGKADDGETHVSHWTALGFGLGVEGGVVYGLISGATAALLGIPAAGKVTTAAVCVIPALDHEPTTPGEERSPLTRYCDNIQIIDDRIEDPAIAGGENAGAWTGQEARKIGQDVRKIFAKLFRRRAKPAAPPATSISATPMT